MITRATTNASDSAAAEAGDDQHVRLLVRARVLRMNSLAMALVIGLLLGIGLFAVTNFLLLRDGSGAGPHLALLGQLLPGYHVTFLGSLIGFFWVFVIGFAATYVGALIYNAIAGHRARKWE